MKAAMLTETQKKKKKKWSLNVVTISMLPRHYEDTVYF